MAVSSARRAASAILLTIERGHAHADELLRGKALADLTATDRHLATALVLGVLRWQIELDQQIRRFLAHPNARLDPEVRIALRLGAFQLLHMDRIPAHAAIDESVELVKQAGHRFASRMVNAVLRKLAVSADGGAITESFEQAYPAWMLERWKQFYGKAEAARFCAFGQREPEPVIRLSEPALEQELKREGIEVAPGRLLLGARIVTRGDVTATRAFREGRIRFQDEGSQLVAEIAGHGNVILDACAAPGGKTLVLAERNPQAKIVACEISSQRLAELEARLEPLAERIECRLQDAAEMPETAAYDLVLADVPCSGTGTLGRNPEIRHRLRLEDLPRQAERQRAILHAALRAAEPGGRIVYSTCSLEPEENESIVAAEIDDQRAVRVLPMRERLKEMTAQGVLDPRAAELLADCVTREGFLRLLPGAFGTDGFFIALLEKAGDSRNPLLHRQAESCVVATE